MKNILHIILRLHIIQTVTIICHSNEHGVEDVNVVTGERRNNVTKDKRGIESRNVSSIKTYINFYYDDDVDNNVYNIRVDGELISLNTLFVDARGEIPVGVNRIFFIIHIEKGDNYGIIKPWLGGVTYATNYSN